jgi:alanyl-tRNA synthetase
MNANELRSKFLEFFASKQHKIVASAPMVVKNDPTLMFTNAGMNQFKDIFLGNSPIVSPRIANSQKCLRVSGKHNDLEEVGHDTYHHTMFEMLGNWSFGDYFKQEAINWAWEFLTEVVGIDKNRLYATVFEGSKEENIEFDNEAKKYWLQYLPEERIINGSKKDNFWEMGESGPCGPCSEVHVDIRSDEERAKIDGRSLVNTGNPHVIEIWNLVFIQFNRKVSGELEPLPHKHVDTGMGFERLCMVAQGKQSNYDSDVFRPLLGAISEISGKPYGQAKETDIAMRVISDHVRTISFAIADGQLPSNNKAGYVIRRILRRAVRYGFTFLGLNEPFLTRLVPVLAEAMGGAYPELKSQQTLIEKVIREEEMAFLHTLETGIKLLDQIIAKGKTSNSNRIGGKEAFELYDTYGFPFDLTQLIARENGFEVDSDGFNLEMQAQKARSRQATTLEFDDWFTLEDIPEVEFIGYDAIDASVKISRYRKVKAKGEELYQLVFDKTPFYAESGGQVGDSGVITDSVQTIEIINTVKENNLIIHLAKELPASPENTFYAKVDVQKRRSTESNHSATHLLHFALRQVLGTHVEQKGSLVDAERLRFDFSHFQKVSEEEMIKIEAIVREKIRQNIELDEHRRMPIADARELGAMALFGEKYGEEVRVIRFGESVELCGGTHVRATSQIGSFKIISESAIAAGIRRIEAISSTVADEYFNNELNTLKEIRAMFKNPKDIMQGIQGLVEKNNALQKQVEAFAKEKLVLVKNQLAKEASVINGINVIARKIEIDSANSMKDLAFQLKSQVDNLFLVLGAELDGKVNLTVAISDNLVNERKLHAGNIVREIAKEVNGGGGGQAFLASAGGTNPEGIAKAIDKALKFIA